MQNPTVARSETGHTTRIAASLDLSEKQALRPVAGIRRPSTANQPFSRLTDGQTHPVTVRRVS